MKVKKQYLIDLNQYSVRSTNFRLLTFDYWYEGVEANVKIDNKAFFIEVNRCKYTVMICFY